MEGTSQVFVSYSSRDRERVLGIVRRIEQAGVSVWIDRDGIPGGANYAEEIPKAIEQAKVLVLMCTRNSLSSQDVRSEIGLKWQYHKGGILPLLLEAASIPQNLHYYLNQCQHLDLADRAAEEWLPEVLHALKRMGVNAGNGSETGAPAQAERGKESDSGPPQSGEAGAGADQGSTPGCPLVVRREVRRVARNLIVWNTILLAIVCAFVLPGVGELGKFVIGPSPLTAEELNGAGADGSRLRQVSADSAAPTPWQDTVRHQGADGITEEITANYSRLAIGNKILLARHRPDRWPDKSCAGFLEPMPSDVESRIIEPAILHHPEWKGKFAGVLLEQRDVLPRWEAVFISAVAAGLITLGVTNLVRAFRFIKDPVRHPSIKRLRRYGSQEAQLRELEQQTRRLVAYPGRTRLLHGWLLQSRTFRFQLIPLKEIATATPLLLKRGRRGVLVRDHQGTPYEFSDDAGHSLFSSIIRTCPSINTAEAGVRLLPAARKLVLYAVYLLVAFWLLIMWFASYRK